MAYYDLKKKPSLTTKEGEKDVLYPAIVYSRTVPSEEILQLVEQRCGFKEGVMAGALMEIMDLTAWHIGKGYRVELGEFGFFSGKLKSTKLVENQGDIRSPSIKISSINFRPSKKFLEQSSGELMYSPKFRHSRSNELSDEILEQHLMNHIRQHGFISRTTYTNLTGRLKKVAFADLERFIGKGLIQRTGCGNQMLFVKAVKEESGKSI